MKEEVYLGIDTSCYTTSILFMNRTGAAVAEARRILKVKPGRCGLQQSEMLYQHIRNLPELVEDGRSAIRKIIWRLRSGPRTVPAANGFWPFMRPVVRPTY